MHMCQPNVGVSIWALITYPPDFTIALWFGDNISQMSICCVVPLLAQVWGQSADVWPSLLCKRLLMGMADYRVLQLGR